MTASSFAAAMADEEKGGAYLPESLAEHERMEPRHARLVSN
jgi:hypothetical protein